MAGILANSASVSMVASAADANQSGFLTGEQIRLHFTPAGASVLWSVAKPTSSLASAALSDETDMAPTFTPDVGGYYVFTAIVDDATVYVLRIGVSSVAQVTPYEAVRLVPMQDEAVPTPVMGAALHESADGYGVAVKRSGPVLKHMEPLAYTPTGSADTFGAVGEVAFDTSYVYVKTASGWKRCALGSF